jgi:PIN domain nuclease of toxin-antitoxin system
VRLLLDTQIVIWLSLTPQRVTESTRTAIGAAESALVSAVCAWEIAIKQRLGQLHYPVERFEQHVAEMGFEPLAIRIDHGLAAGALPLHHRDPFDRMLVAQARVEGMTLVTADQHLSRYDVAILPAW